MARTMPENRFDDLVRAATEIFIARGYERTQMAEVADEMGVAKGTLYVYVESKEALFHLCLLHADDPNRVRIPPELPVPTPPEGEIVRLIRRGVRRRGGSPVLTEALELPRARDPRGELEAVLHELYEGTERHCRGIKLIERCGDHPELDGEWYRLGRQVTRDRLASYIQSRVRANQFHSVGDLCLAARLVIETIATWAIHIKWDPSPQQFEPKAAEDNVISFLCRGLLKE